MSGTADTEARIAAERRLQGLMQVRPATLARMATAEIERLAQDIAAERARTARLGIPDDGR